MTALAANADRVRTGLGNTLRGDGGVAASTTIYKHSLVTLDAGVVTTVKGTSPNCVGYSKQKYDNSSGAASAITATYYYNDMIEIAASSVTNGHINTTMYAKDDNTVVPTATTGPAVGILKKLSGSTATVLVGVANPAAAP